MPEGQMRGKVNKVFLILNKVPPYPVFGLKGEVDLFLGPRAKIGPKAPVLPSYFP